MFFYSDFDVFLAITFTLIHYGILMNQLLAVGVSAVGVDVLMATL